MQGSVIKNRREIGKADTKRTRRKRNTRQRQAVLSAISALDGRHPTAADIYARLRDEHPNLSLATVYRALHALTEDRTITEMRVENVARYDAGPHPHHHLICRQCGQASDIDACSLPPGAIETLLQSLLAGGFAPDPFPIQFYGVCKKCQKDKEDK